MFEIFAELFLGSTAVMVGGTLYLGFLQWRDDRRATRARKK